jgi:uncharacterized protein YdaU (DUF1376 family)
MAKSPAVLFYTSDFLSGTLTMSDEEVGKYIRLLCLQHQQDRISEKHMKKICGSCEDEVLTKFVKDERGFYNERMEIEILKRQNYSQSRANNRKDKEPDKKDMKNISKTYVEHMENENEDVNEIEIVNLYHEICISLSKVKTLSKGRILKIKTRHKEIKTLEAWREIFIRASKSDFLNGIKSDWKANFDWMIENDTNWLKIIEGKYDNKGETPQQKTDLVKGTVIHCDNKDYKLQQSSMGYLFLPSSACPPASLGFKNTATTDNGQVWVLQMEDAKC